MKSIIVLVSLVLTSMSVYAYGFGVSGQAPKKSANKDAINKLMNQTNSSIVSQTRADGQQLVAADNSQNQGDSQPVLNSATRISKNNSFGNTGMSQQAFAQMLRNLMPLTPQQIKTLHKLFNKSKRAVSAYPGTPPKPTSSSVMVNLSPGATPPVVRLRQGYVTSIVFLDSTGQPWPITSYDLGDPKDFNLQPNQPDGKSNTILVQALDTYKPGNLAVMLKGLDTPIMITLMPGQQAVDYRIDMRVPGMGPNAEPTINGMPATASPQLLTFLNGVPPKGANQVDVEGGNCQGWEYRGKLYIRTRMTLLSPSWISTMSSPDGTHVYELTKTPIILVSNRGAIQQLAVQGL